MSRVISFSEDSDKPWNANNTHVPQQYQRRRLWATLVITKGDEAEPPTSTVSFTQYIKQRARNLLGRADLLQGKLLRGDRNALVVVCISKGSLGL